MKPDKEENIVDIDPASEYESDENDGQQIPTS